MMKKILKIECAFCGKELYKDSQVLLPECGCKEAAQAREENYKLRLEEHKKELAKQDNYDEKFPVTFSGERIVPQKDGAHKLKLESRKYNDGEGLCVWIPFPRNPKDPSYDENSGLAWGFTKEDAKALHELLTEYFENDT